MSKHVSYRSLFPCETRYALTMRRARQNYKSVSRPVGGASVTCRLATGCTTVLDVREDRRRAVARRAILVSPFFRCFFIHYSESRAAILVAVSCAAGATRAAMPRGCEYTEPTPGTNCASPPQTLHEIDNSGIMAQHPLSGYLRPQEIQHALCLASCRRFRPQAGSGLFQALLQHPNARGCVSLVCGSDAIS